MYFCTIHKAPADFIVTRNAAGEIAGYIAGHAEMLNQRGMQLVYKRAGWLEPVQHDWHVRCARDAQHDEHVMRFYDA